MCGIVGIWHHGRPDLPADRFRAVVESLAHRGPDDEGIHHDPEVRLHLGHRRLAILDPTPAGAQPMCSDDGALVIVHNGEIYDFVELRQELETLGHHFRTDTDTEVLLSAYRQWGEGMLARLNGMWAFAIWDRRERRLFAARDRFGVKPLLYRASDGAFAFASELKAFAAMPGGVPALDTATLTFSPMLMETVGPTLLEGVRALPPGHLLNVDVDGRFVERRWWTTADHLPVAPTDLGQQVDEFRERFADACRIRLRADVPIGTSLSGGLDSSAVVAMVHHVGGQQGFTADWQRVFSQGHPGTQQDESVWADAVSRHLGVALTRTDTGLDIDGLEASVLAFEGVHFLPLGVWAHYRSLREQGVLISIDGHGGDELLGGYDRFPAAMRRATLSSLRLRTWSGYAETSLGLRGDPVTRAALGRLLMEDLASLGPLEALRRGIGTTSIGRQMRDARRRRAAGDAGQSGLIAPVDEVLAREQLLRERSQTIGAETTDMTQLGALLYRAFHHEILPSILRNFDRLSMASGVEIRSPLLDWRLVTYANSLPDTARIGGGFTKRILRDATQGLLPDEVRLRRDKKGFTSPVIALLAGGLGGVALEVVNDPGFLGRPTWDGAAIRARVSRAHADARWADLKRDWSFVQAELLLRGLEGVARTANSRAAGP
jgi:asparagine synthase (glutamine-hydrolysing)